MFRYRTARKLAEVATGKAGPGTYQYLGRRVLHAAHKRSKRSPAMQELGSKRVKRDPKERSAVEQAAVELYK
jgi:hypothetical protein